jgi:hypothetical protein
VKKFWIIYAEKNSGQFKRYETLEAASDDARRIAAIGDSEYVILEAISVTKKPVPPIEIILL